MTNAEFTDRINALRRSRDWTWEETAKAVGLSRTMIHFIKTGKNPVSRDAKELLETAESAGEYLDPKNPKFNMLMTMASPVPQTEKDAGDPFRGELVNPKNVRAISDTLRLKSLSNAAISRLYEHFVVASNRVSPEFAKFYVLVSVAISKDLERRWKMKG